VPQCGTVSHAQDERGRRVMGRTDIQPVLKGMTRKGGLVIRGERPNPAFLSVSPCPKAKKE